MNRVWANFMGRGLVNPVDDLRATNPASNEELFAALSKDFVEHDYDVQTADPHHHEFQRLSAFAPKRTPPIRSTTYIIRSTSSSGLPAEVMLDAMSQVTGVPTAFAGYPGGHARACSCRTRR